MKNFFVNAEFLFLRSDISANYTCTDSGQLKKPYEFPVKSIKCDLSRFFLVIFI